MASVHILHVDGRVDSAGMVIIELTSRLPVVGSLGRMGRRKRPLRWSAEGAYRVVARNRHHLAALVKDVPPVIRWRDDRD